MEFKLSLILIFLPMICFASIKEQLRRNFNWAAEVEQVTSVDNINQVHLYGGLVNFNSKANLSPKLTLDFEISCSWFEGLSQLESEELAYTEGATFNHLHLVFSNTIYVGVIDQNIFNSPLLLYEVGFPGLMVNFKGKNFYFLSELTVPSFKGIQVDRVEGEKLPFLGVMAIGFNSRKVLFSGGIFSYERPTSLMGAYSINLGNSVDALGDRGIFREKYRGFISTAGLHLKKWKLDWNYLRNFEVSSSKGEALLLSLAYSDGLGFKLQYFYSESDSTIGIYSHHNYGYNNTQGFGVSLTYEGRSYNLVLDFFKYRQIFNSNYNRRDQKIGIVLEVPYE